MKLMKKLFMNVFLLAGIAAATLLLGDNANALLIDDFNGGYGEVSGAEIKDLIYFNAWSGGRSLRIDAGSNDRLSVELETGAGINGILWHENGDERANDSLVVWQNCSVTCDTPDLTDGGNSDRFTIEFLSVRSDDVFNLRVDGGVNSRSVEFTVAGPGTKTILFSEFGLLPSDFEEVTFVELTITGISPLASIQIDSIQTTGPAAVFEDIPPGYWAEEQIYKIYEAGITSGCSQNPLLYCPEDPVTRAEIAVFLERGINGSDYDPPGATGIFDDVPVSYWAADWVEQLYADGITGGCSTDPPLYCPDDVVNRAQMAVFLLRSMNGEDYTPPSAEGIFDDVPVTYWAANWIEQLYADGITGGCSTDPPLYCPDDVVNRAQMAVFIVRAFGL